MSRYGITSKKVQQKCCLGGRVSAIRFFLLFALLGMLFVPLLSCMTTVPRKHYYLLALPMPEAQGRTSITPYHVRVKDFKISATYNRSQLVYRYSLHELEYYNYRLWTLKPQKMVSDLVRRYVAHTGLFAKVSERLGDTAPDFVLSGEIEAIEELDSDEKWFAHLAMAFTLQRFSDSRILWKYSFDRRRPVPEKEPRIVVKTISEILSTELVVVKGQLEDLFSSGKAFPKKNKISSELLKGTTESKTGHIQGEEGVKKWGDATEVKEHSVAGTDDNGTEMRLKEDDSAIQGRKNSTKKKHFKPMVSSPWFDTLQYTSDTKPIPTGKGAIFIPALSSPEREPTAIIFKDGRKIGSSIPGRKIIVEPGNYVVRVGSGTMEQMSEVDAEVAEQRVTVIEPFWSALDVRVVDDHFIPFRGSYEIIALPSREEFGIGFGADEERGEKTNVWLLLPGLYKIVKAGGTYRDRKNFATVLLERGKLTVFTLVQDPETNDFLGAGVIEEEKGQQVLNKWRFRTLLGGDLLFINQTSSTSGRLEGWTSTGNLFFDNYITFTDHPHRLSLRLEVEEGQSKQPDERARTLNDRLYFHSIYTYFVGERIGPYVRGGVESALTDRYFYFENPDIYTVSILPSDSGKGPQFTAQERWKQAESWAPTQFIEGAGGNLQMFNNEYLDFNVRLGLGYRQYYAYNYLTYIDSGDNWVTFQEVDDYSLNGFELSIVSFARLTRYLAWSCEVDSLFPFRNSNAYLLTLRSLLSLRLTSYLSLNYKLDLTRDPNVNERHPTITQHQIQLRFSYSIF